MHNQRRRALVLDFGQVLTINHDPACYDAVLAGLGLDRGRFLDNYGRDRPDFDAGRLDAGAYWRRLLAACGVEPPPAVLAELVEADYRAWCRPREAMHRTVIRALDAGTPAAVLSNMPPGVGGRFVADWNWLARIPWRLFSGDLGLVKPEPEIYRHLQDLTGWESADILFVDDRADNLATASALGWSVHHFIDEAAGIKAVADWCALV
jgi:putative hydrolase of the HAD superfamily